MMTPDQIETRLLAARKTLASTHDLLDCLTLFASIIAAALGWMAAYLQFKASFRKGLEKEHYYASKQNVIEILRLDGDFLDYRFHKLCPELSPHLWQRYLELGNQLFHDLNAHLR